MENAELFVTMHCEGGREVPEARKQWKMVSGTGREELQVSEGDKALSDMASTPEWITLRANILHLYVFEYSIM